LKVRYLCKLIAQLSIFFRYFCNVAAYRYFADFDIKFEVIEPEIIHFME